MGGTDGPGGSNPFDFESNTGGSAPFDEPTQPIAAPPPIARPVRSPDDHRGQSTSWVALALALAMSVLVGYTAFRTLVAIDVVSDNPLGSAFNWLTLLVVAVVGVFVALIIAVIAVFKARPRLVATLALIMAVVLPWITLLIGIKFGAEIFVVRAQRELAVSGGQVAGAVIQTLSDKGVDLGPFRELLERLLR